MLPLLSLLPFGRKPMDLTVMAKSDQMARISPFWRRILTSAEIWLVGIRLVGIRQWLPVFDNGRLLEHEGRLHRLKKGRLRLPSGENLLSIFCQMKIILRLIIIFTPTTRKCRNYFSETILHRNNRSISQRQVWSFLHLCKGKLRLLQTTAAK